MNVSWIEWLIDGRTELHSSSVFKQQNHVFIIQSVKAGHFVEEKLCENVNHVFNRIMISSYSQASPFTRLQHIVNQNDSKAQDDQIWLKVSTETLNHLKHMHLTVLLQYR